ncbi:unnamed protein product [Schistocephalus solidus]|uniref:BPTI/Kunitz inhibitor domain-containing protein n=1 Tax=Schistocephalus solidus TaxID=70667 RepID=A0A3P7CCX7_SCHSO|nr:unnamed protein product [Schistocephalus solidus]
MLCVQTINPICDLPRERGNCLGAMLSVYFDSRDGKCKPFVYSGCGGNENSFISNDACMKTSFCSSFKCYFPSSRMLSLFISDCNGHNFQ